MNEKTTTSQSVSTGMLNVMIAATEQFEKTNEEEAVNNIMDALNDATTNEPPVNEGKKSRNRLFVKNLLMFIIRNYR